MTVHSDFSHPIIFVSTMSTSCYIFISIQSGSALRLHKKISWVIRITILDHDHGKTNLYSVLYKDKILFSIQHGALFSGGIQEQIIQELKMGYATTVYIISYEDEISVKTYSNKYIVQPFSLQNIVKEKGLT
jgi:hypothetical protein